MDKCFETDCDIECSCVFCAIATQRFDTDSEGIYLSSRLFSKYSPLHILLIINVLFYSNANIFKIDLLTN